MRQKKNVEQKFGNQGGPPNNGNPPNLPPGTTPEGDPPGGWQIIPPDDDPLSPPPSGETPIMFEKNGFEANLYPNGELQVPWIDRLSQLLNLRSLINWLGNGVQTIKAYATDNFAAEYFSTPEQEAETMAQLNRMAAQIGFQGVVVLKGAAAESGSCSPGYNTDVSESHPKSSGFRKRLHMMNSPFDGSALDEYGYAINDILQKDQLQTFPDHERVIKRIFEILARKAETNRKYNPLVIAEDENLQGSVVLEVVRRLVLRESPDGLPAYRVITPNFSKLLYDATGNIPDMRREGSDPKAWIVQNLTWPSVDVEAGARPWSANDIVLSRFRAFFSAVRQTREPILLWLPNFPRFVSASAAPDSIDLAPMLVPMLARREIQFLGTANLEQYRRDIERDASLFNRVQAVVARSDEELHT